MGLEPKTDSVVTAAAEDDAERLRLLQRGDDAASEQFVRDQMARALAVAGRILGNEADAHEAVQEGFLSFFRSLAEFRGDAALSTWLHRIVVNAALMKRRAMRRRPETSIESLLPRFLDDGHRADPLPAWPEKTEDLVARREVRQLVRKKIDELPENYRNVILLRDIEQIDTAETARLLGETPGAIKTRLHRARQALRTLLETESHLWTDR